jgi:hypothetical protein
MGTLYPALMRLEQRGLIRSHDRHAPPSPLLRPHPRRPPATRRGHTRLGSNGGHRAGAPARRGLTWNRRSCRRRAPGCGGSWRRSSGGAATRISRLSFARTSSLRPTTRGAAPPPPTARPRSTRAA